MTPHEVTNGASGPRTEESGPSMADGSTAEAESIARDVVGDIVSRVASAADDAKNAAITDRDIEALMALDDGARLDAIGALTRAGAKGVAGRVGKATRAADRGNLRLISSNAAPKQSHDFERGDHTELGRALLGSLPSDASPVFDLGACHTYNEALGTWKAVDRSEESRIVQRFAGKWVDAGDSKPKVLRLRATDVKGSIELAHDQAAIPGFFDAAPAGLAFQNGFLRFVNGKAAICEHAPDNRARFAYGFSYDRAAPCERWIKFLGEVFRDDADRDDKIACLQEYAGASLVGIAPSYQKAMILRGEGQNGKSVLGKVLSRCMPDGSVCSVPPQKWGDDYHRSHMAGSRLNFVPELPESEIIKADSVKSIIDGSEQTSRNPYEKVIKFVPRFGNIWNANGLPATSDHSHAFWRRFIVIEFNRIFGASEAVIDLESALLGETRGIVSWIIAGAERIMKQGRFTEAASSELAKSKWRRDADNVALFVDACARATVSHGERTPAKVVYQRFDAWCKSNGHKPMSSNTFGRRMKGLGLGSEPAHDGFVYPITLLPSIPQDEEDFILRKAGYEARPGNVDLLAADEFERT